MFEWICHSNYSFLVGASFPEELIQQAVSYGYEGLAITDMDGLYGAARAYIKRTSGVKLFWGSELHLAADHEESIYFQKTIVLLALCKKGYSNLCTLLSFAHRHGKSGAFLTLEELAQQDLKGIVALQPMRGIIRSEPIKSLHTKLLTLKSLFKDGLYLTVGCFDHPLEDSWIPLCYRLSQELSLPLLFSQDVFFHHPSRKK